MIALNACVLRFQLFEMALRPARLLAGRHELDTTPKPTWAVGDAAITPMRRLLEGHRSVGEGIPEQIPVTAADGAGELTACLEALQNAAKHAGDAARPRVRLTEEGEELRFEVVDDGVGFDPHAADGSAGLQNMVDRIGALGGEVAIESAPGRGARVGGKVPVAG